MQFLGGFKLCCTSRKVFAIVHKGDFSACFKRLLDWSLFVLWSLVQAIFIFDESLHLLVERELIVTG